MFVCLSNLGLSFADSGAWPWWILLVIVGGAVIVLVVLIVSITCMYSCKYVLNFHGIKECIIIFVYAGCRSRKDERPRPTKNNENGDVERGFSQRASALYVHIDCVSVSVSVYL